MSIWRTQPLPPHWARTRRRVFSRDNRTCYVCGQPGADEVDHIVPASEDGSDEDYNLAAIHAECHAAKTIREALAHNWRATTPRKREPERHPGSRNAP